jgi:glyoxylase-like metal-dependent hydrolase (beta-lactamase superfamily II)
MQVFKGIRLTGGVGYDSNVYVIDGEVIVDTGTGLFFQQLKEEIENLYQKSDLKTIVNTHCHFDHTGGNKKMRDFLKAKIAVHENDAKALEEGKTLANLFNEDEKIITVDEKLGEGDKIKTRNFSFDVIETPGHTSGSICLYEPRKYILISGDTLFEDSVGRTDLPGGNKKALKESLERLLGLNISYLCPGHGMPKKAGVGFLIKRMINKIEEAWV